MCRGLGGVVVGGGEGGWIVGGGLGLHLMFFFEVDWK